jgi:hypothetical protein
MILTQIGYIVMRGLDRDLRVPRPKLGWTLWFKLIYRIPKNSLFYAL